MTDLAQLGGNRLAPPADAVQAIADGRHGAPFDVLGPHEGPGGTTTIGTFQPEADDVDVLDADSGRVLAHLNRIHSAGFFFGYVADRELAKYRLRLRRLGATWEIEDAYCFPPSLGELDLHLIAEGTHRKLFEKLGAHPTLLEGVPGVRFAVWAPNAARVSVVGPFNNWDGRCHPMWRHGTGVWELFIPGIQRDALYKYELLSSRGRLLPLKADPFAFAQELPPATASKVHGLPSPPRHDAPWLAHRRGANDKSAPISIYEVHLGSWRRGGGESYLDYDRLAEELVAYVKDLGFTHVELLPVMEHPFSGSWGYQPIGLFAPTSRFGTPEQFTRFVEKMHEAGIGVILDWVPAHFPSDAFGLARFDGTALYEHQDPRRGFHNDWNTLIYNLGRHEVANFLSANALFWLEQYHVDGLRVDAVASMLYLDYSRKAGEWIPNEYGGRENLEAVRFLRDVNTNVSAAHPEAVTIAEESTAWPKVSRPVDSGGLGFAFKWNMGWMHDTLAYMREDPVHRRYHQGRLTFGLLYAYDENFILPLSHDEVVHGKGSLLQKMPGDRWQKFANLRAYFGFMWTHPGKKLLFMGGEFAQDREWRHDHSLDWHLLSDDLHRGVQNLVRDLNRLYREMPALHERDCEPEGFSWVDTANAAESVLAYLRWGATGSPALVVCNFTPVVRGNYRLGIPRGGRWTERLNTDSAFYGGSNVGNGGAVEAENVASHGHPFSLSLTLPPLAVVVFTPLEGERP
ncbi:MAG: 1,4-alpha-glucan branching protein GlgB [Hyphomicrobiales bacterium]|nr:MAG: 1,4-alpha-glucan branching protein GlgB [Hyphomicrobiales bacterium]